MKIKTSIMTNEEKIKEIVREQPYATQNDNYATMIEYGARKMAEWKDKQFSTENYKYYNPIQRMTREEAISSSQPVCVLVDADGNPQGVLVQALGERFVIEPKDFNDGNEMTWDDAMTELNAEDKTTFSKQQAYLVMFLIDHINAALSSIGGEELASSHWAATECNSSYAWVVSFGSGGFGNFNKYSSYVVRAITNL